eukprot:m.341751 g.341751  ORF g.341751 m.341751 type:complete len:418 (+) comp20454_c0_seq1:125-1378(+)
MFLFLLQVPMLLGEGVLVKLSAEEVQPTKAFCLDGSNPAMYVEKTKNASSENATKWVLTLQGGGACTSLSSCVNAAGGSRGTSNNLKPTGSAGYSPGSSSMALNPMFYDWNHVMFQYCDGMFFAGGVEGPIDVSNMTKKISQIWMRGFSILNALLKNLVKDHGLTSATEVLLNGGSAGGYAAYLHTDFIHEFLKSNSPKLNKYKSVPFSGLFLNGSNYEGKYPFGELQEKNFKLHNVTEGVNHECLAAFPTEPWRCAAPETNFAYTKAPIFLANSLLDPTVLFSSFFNPPPQGVTCIQKIVARKGTFADCSDQAIEDFNKLQVEVTKLLTTIKPVSGQTTPTLSKPGNGAFLHHCLTHDYFASGWQKLILKDVNAMQAIVNWWLDEDTAPSSKHTYIETCEFKTSGERECNPSCPYK